MVRVEEEGEKGKLRRKEVKQNRQVGEGRRK